MTPQGIIAGAEVANTAMNIAGMALGEEKVGLSREDQRWIADFNWKQSLRQEQLQNDLAKHGISMRVKDAQAAGIHPLAALGIPLAQSSGGQQVFGGDSEPGGPGKVARGLGQMGQNLSRAAMAASTLETREEVAINRARMLADIEFTRANAALALAQAEAMRNPPMPSLWQKFDVGNGETVTLMNPDAARGYGPISGLFGDMRNLWRNPDSVEGRRRGLSLFGDMQNWGRDPRNRR